MKEKSYEILGLHKYKVTLGGKEREIAFPWITSSAIEAIILGTAGEFKGLIMEAITADGFKFNETMLEKALELLNPLFAVNLKNQVTEICSIALDEYDAEGHLKTKGNCSMLFDEDIAIIIKVVVDNFQEVLKNVFGMEVIKKETIPSPIQESPETKENED